jgi:hypothetical protein
VASSMGRRASLPDAVSRKIHSHPAAVSASRCASVLWSLVLIRPYPKGSCPMCCTNSYQCYYATLFWTWVVRQGWPDGGSSPVSVA